MTPLTANEARTFDHGESLTENGYRDDYHPLPRAARCPECSHIRHDPYPCDADLGDHDCECSR